jgi:hypothetical protein
MTKAISILVVMGIAGALFCSSAARGQSEKLPLRCTDQPGAT